MAINRFLTMSVALALLTLIGVVLYAMWWNAHFACVQYNPF